MDDFKSDFEPNCEEYKMSEQKHRHDEAFKKFLDVYLSCRPHSVDECDGCPFDSDDCIWLMGRYLRITDGWKKYNSRGFTSTVRG